MKTPVINRHLKGDWIISPPDEFHPPIVGEGFVLLTKVHAPPGEELQRMLLELRRQMRWSQTFAAATLGVSKSAVVRWENGSRVPTGSAAKLIFLLYHLLVDQTGKVKNAWDLSVWGLVPCRHAFQELEEVMKRMELEPTVFIRNTVVSELGEES